MSCPTKGATRGLLLLAAGLFAVSAAADEIRLKDGKKLYGVIVAFEENMFKVKTDFGYVLVEKDKIAAIIPTTSGPTTSGPTTSAQPKSETKAAAKPAAKKEPLRETPKPAAETKEAAAKEESQPKTAPAAETARETAGASSGREKAVTRSAKEKETATTAKASAPAPAVPPREPEPALNREEVQGNTYINHTHGFRIYKAPSWSVLDDARRALPNAIVALGTSSESTLMVVGQEKTTEPLEATAAAVERRLHEAYENYRRLEQKKTQVGGLPAVEYRYRGKEGEHDWSGTLAVVARGKDIFTVLGVTYADSDLIQIQENVIARAIASLDFSAH